MSNNSNSTAPPQAEAPSNTIRDQIDGLTLQNLIDGSPKTCPTVLGIWKKYKKWVELTQRVVPTAYPPYCNRDFLDLFFVSVVAKQDWKKSYAQKHVSSFQYFSDFDVTEHAGKSPRFIVQSTSISQAINCMDTRARNEKKRSRDPHANLPTDILSFDDELKLLREGLSNPITWADFAVSWTWGTSCFIRSHSMRASYVKHLITLDSYGPPLNPNTAEPTAPMLALILLAGEHKDNKNQTRVVGGWRHRLYLKCFTGMTAMSCMMKLSGLTNAEFNFYRTSRKTIMSLRGSAE
jgi:hypothetical protein